jgi:SAM-dependent methyltransferase
VHRRSVGCCARKCTLWRLPPGFGERSLKTSRRKSDSTKRRFGTKELSTNSIGGANYLLDDPEGRQWQINSQNPNLPVTDSFVLEHITSQSKTEIRIIDVGAGPITKIGYTVPRKILRIVAVDPLAKHYDSLLRRNGTFLPVSTIQGDGENLLQQFPARSFDLAYACNALDHSYDPLTIMQNMIHLVRTGGHVLLRHFRNEAKVGAYHGLHQWNFDCRDGRFMVWQPNSIIDVGDRFGQQIELSCSIEKAGIFDNWNECILVSMKVH